MRMTPSSSSPPLGGTTGSPYAATLLLVMPLPLPGSYTLPFPSQFHHFSGFRLFPWPPFPTPCHHAIPITMTITRRLGTIEQYAGLLSPSSPFPNPPCLFHTPLRLSPFLMASRLWLWLRLCVQHQINRFHCAVGIQLDYPQAPSFDSSTLPASSFPLSLSQLTVCASFVMAICINKSLAAAFWTSPSDSGQMDSGTRAQLAQGEASRRKLCE